MNLLVKFPSRERPIQFFRRMSEVMGMATDPNTRFLVSLDHNDLRLTSYQHLEVMKDPRVTVVVGKSHNKIDAVNRDIKEYKDHWDIILILSDDQICQKQGWDTIIINEMKENYPDTDGVLYFNDGYQKRLNTQCILGRKYYDRFGFVYDPRYKSLFADNAFMEIADKLKKQTRYDEVLFKHEHYSNSPVIKADALMVKTESFYKEDQKTYEKHKHEINNSYSNS